MALMRLFTGLDLADAVVKNLSNVVAGFRPLARLQWSPAENLHITTKFIGEWPEERLPELQAALARVPARQEIDVKMANLGFFPNPRGPRVLFCGITASGLEALAADTENATESVGIERDRRAYSPHLTLARTKNNADLGQLQSALSSLPPTNFGEFTARSFFLYRSQLRPTGSVYTKLAEFPFKQQ